MNGKERMLAAAEHERAVIDRLRALGYSAEPFGQALLTASVRQYLARTESLLRWLPDVAAMGADPYDITLIDAKTAISSNTPYHAIQMQSLLGSKLTEIPVWYVCDEFKALPLTDIVNRGPDRVCCADCWARFNQQPQSLPTYCPEHSRRGGRGSGTPYILVSKSRCIALPPAGSSSQTIGARVS